MNELRPEWSSYLQLIQDVMGGAVRRNTFSRWELDLLLDLDQSRIRKSARAEVLRRYARHIQQQAATEGGEPLRFSTFLEMDSQRNAISGGSS